MGSVMNSQQIPNRASLILKISTSAGHRGRVTNVDWSWGDLVRRLKRPTVDKLTLPQFKALSEDAQLKRKNNGYFVGGQFRGGIRQKTHMRDRYLLTFDIDECTPELLAGLETGLCGLGDYEYVVYSTRKHSSAAPRVRIVLPLPEPLETDKFEPLSRIVAAKLDGSMKAVDPVSFRYAQYMYWPSVCTGEDFCFVHNRGDVLNAEAVLAEYGDWQDYALLPRSDRERELRKAEAKAPDPREKNNLVGVYCRRNNIHETISEFLSDVYTAPESEADNVTPARYTYSKGSTTGGAVVHDDGQYLFSHHGTDPCGGKLVNAFDLRRIHEFGHLDEEAEEGTPVHKLPSYLALQEALKDDPEVRDELVQINYGDTDGSWDDIEDDSSPTGTTSEGPTASPEEAGEASDTAVATDWMAGLDTDGNGFVKPSLPNLILILENGKIFKGCFGYDEFIQEDVVLRAISSRKLNLHAPGREAGRWAGRMTDHHLTVIRAILESKRGKGLSGWGLQVSDRNLLEAHRAVSRRNRIHPVRDWLGTLKWDGVPRVEKLWIKACHTPDNAYYRQTARMWLIGAVARVFEPGCKFDFAPIIEGRQGLRKSTMLSRLGGTWYGETDGNFDDQQKYIESTQGVWINEFPELVQFSRSEVSSIKACISRQVDVCRMAYARFKQAFPRQHVSGGTTNERHYLKDKTGNRRFWPIPCGDQQINTGWIARKREQIWAEAVAGYRTMREKQPEGELPLFLSDPEAAAFALALQEDRVVADGSDELAAMIAHWLDQPVPPAQAKPGAELGDAGDALEDDSELILRTMVCAKDIWAKVLQGDMKGYDERQQKRIGGAMKRVPGWAANGRLAPCGRFGRQKVYERMD